MLFTGIWIASTTIIGKTAARSARHRRLAQRDGAHARHRFIEGRRIGNGTSSGALRISSSPRLLFYHRSRTKASVASR